MDRVTKYFLFAYDGYYPAGGSEDCKGIFDTEQQAFDYLENHSRIMERDYVELCDIRNNEFNLVYDRFDVVDGEGYMRCVFGDQNAKTIKAIAAFRKSVPRTRYYTPHLEPMGDYNLDDIIELPDMPQ
jgi:hypothetical protein